MKYNVPIAEMIHLHREKINPQSIDEVVEHYSIPAWPSKMPEVVRSKSIQSSKFILPDEPTILVSRLNPRKHKVWRIGNNETGRKRLASTEWAVVMPYNNEDYDYISCILNTKLFHLQLEAYVTGTTGSHQRVTPDDFMRLLMPILPEATRAQIGKLYRLLETYQNELFQMERQLEQLVEVIFTGWFVSFNHVKSNLISEGSTETPNGIRHLYPSSLVTSEIGLIPRGWKIVELGDIISLDKGLSYKGKYLANSELEGKPMLNLGCFGIDGSFRREKIKYYSGPFRERHVLKEGDLLIANTDMTQDRVILGASIVVPKIYSGSLFTHHTYRAKAKKPSNDILLPLINKLLTLFPFRYRAEGYSVGTTVLSMPAEAVLKHKIALPPTELINRFANIYQMMIKYREQSIVVKKQFELIEHHLFPSIISSHP